MTVKKNEVTVMHLLLPMSLLAFAMLFLFIFQISQIMNDREMLNKAHASLDAPFADSESVNKQFGGLVAGAQKLAQEGNKIAQNTIAELKKIGVNFTPSDKASSSPDSDALKSSSDK